MTKPQKAIELNNDNEIPCNLQALSESDKFLIKTANRHKNTPKPGADEAIMAMDCIDRIHEKMNKRDGIKYPRGVVQLIVARYYEKWLDGNIAYEAKQPREESLERTSVPC